GHRPQRKDRFTSLLHRLDCVLEAPRGRDRAELASGGIDQYSASCNGSPIDAGDERGAVHEWVPDADGIGLAGNAWIADVDIVTAGSEILASTNTASTNT